MPLNAVSHLPCHQQPWALLSQVVAWPRCNAQIATAKKCNDALSFEDHSRWSRLASAYKRCAGKHVPPWRPRHVVWIDLAVQKWSCISRTHAQDLDQITWLNTVLWQYHTATSWTATNPYHAFHRRSVEFKSALTIGDYPAHTPLPIPQQRYRLALLPRFHLHLLQHFQKDLYNQIISNLVAAWASSDWPVASLSLPFRL